MRTAVRQHFIMLLTLRRNYATIIPECDLIKDQFFQAMLLFLVPERMPDAALKREVIMNIVIAMDSFFVSLFYIPLNDLHNLLLCVVL